MLRDLSPETEADEIAKTCLLAYLGGMMIESLIHAGAVKLDKNRIKDALAT
jgi:hypothetical protein